MLISSVNYLDGYLYMCIIAVNLFPTPAILQSTAILMNVDSIITLGRDSNVTVCAFTDGISYRNVDAINVYPKNGNCVIACTSYYTIVDCEFLDSIHILSIQQKL